MSQPSFDHLPHATDDCTGVWKQIGERGTGFWRCAACGREHPSTPENDRASDLEFVAGVQLKSQARQGRFCDLLPRKPPGIWMDLSREDEEEKG